MGGLRLHILSLFYTFSKSPLLQFLKKNLNSLPFFQFLYKGTDKQFQKGILSNLGCNNRGSNLIKCQPSIFTRLAQLADSVPKS